MKDKLNEIAKEYNKLKSKSEDKEMEKEGCNCGKMDCGECAMEAEKESEEDEEEESPSKKGPTIVIAIESSRKPSKKQ